MLKQLLSRHVPSPAGLAISLAIHALIILPVYAYGQPVAAMGAVATNPGKGPRLHPAAMRAEAIDHVFATRFPQANGNIAFIITPVLADTTVATAQTPSPQ